MTHNILESVKNFCNLDYDNTDFDDELIGHINGVFLSLYQIGVGPKSGYAMEDTDTEWTDYTSNPILLGCVPEYVKIKVRMIYDPPANSTLLQNLKDKADELEWRIKEIAERGDLYSA